MLGKFFGLSACLLIILILQPASLFAAVGCELNDPDRDVKRVFPDSTGYKTALTFIKDKGGDSLVKKLEERLGDKFDPVFEAVDTPHTFYTVLKGKQTIGYIHGVNQKGTFGGMQIFLAIDTKGKILEFFYQKISSPEVKKFQNKEFTKQFNGLTLADFYDHDKWDGRACCPPSVVSKIKDPSTDNARDFAATLRGIKMNLILSDKFLLNDKYEKAYTKTKA